MAENDGWAWLLGLAGLLALVGASFFGTGTNPIPVVHAGVDLNDGWVNGDQSGSLVWPDPEGKFTQGFPLQANRFVNPGQRTARPGSGDPAVQKSLLIR